jgi:isopropylmalate/homocitrate/citramalate synthase
MATFPERGPVEIVEVAPRDGLQNHERTVPTAAKISFVDALSRAGFRTIEATSFVSPAAVPKMADAADVMTGISRKPGVRYLVLVPNERGLDRAIEAGANAIAVFGSSSETFSQRNINCTIQESMQRFTPVVKRAKAEGFWVRGYLSMAFVCPFEGPISPAQTSDLAKRLHELGCDEICLADTIGSATPEQVGSTLDATIRQVPVQALALHMHDTYGLAVENVDIGYEAGIRVFDSAAGGLGGCPFAPGAAGNLSTQRLLHHLDRRGIPHGIDIAVVERAVDELFSPPDR